MTNALFYRKTSRSIVHMYGREILQPNVILCSLIGTDWCPDRLLIPCLPKHRRAVIVRVQRLGSGGSVTACARREAASRRVPESRFEGPE